MYRRAGRGRRYERRREGRRRRGGLIRAMVTEFIVIAIVRRILRRAMGRA